jgi:hypothetical protein
MSWIAEDVPWYQVDQESRRMTMTDEDYAMSAPRRLGEFATKQEARQAVAGDLEQSSTYSFVARGGEREKYLVAAQAVLAGVDGIRIHGRYYRVREV